MSEKPDDQAYDQPMDSDELLKQLESCTPPTLGEEAREWRRRSHLLWSWAEQSQDLRSAASALTVAFRGLEAWQKEMEAQAATSASAGITEEEKAEIISEDTERIVAKINEINAREGMTDCPVCGLGSTTIPVARLICSHFAKGGSHYMEYRIAAGLEDGNGNNHHAGN